MNIIDIVTASIPDLVVLEETGGLFLPDFNIQQILGFLVGVRDKVLITQKGEKTDDEGKQKQREGDSIEADPTCLHSCDLTMSG